MRPFACSVCVRNRTAARAPVARDRRAARRRRRGSAAAASAAARRPTRRSSASAVVLLGDVDAGKAASADLHLVALRCGLLRAPLRVRVRVGDGGDDEEAVPEEASGGGLGGVGRDERPRLGWLTLRLTSVREHQPLRNPDVARLERRLQPGRARRRRDYDRPGDARGAPTGLLRAWTAGPSEDDSTEEGRARRAAAAAPAAAPDLVDQVVPNARNAQAQQQQAAAAAAALGADRLELQAGARWLEDSLPFVVLLLLVFLQQHIFGIGAFCWLSTVLHNANARIRTQVLLKEQRDSLAVLSLASLLFSQMCMVVMLCGASKLRAQLALRPEHDGRQASSIFELLGRLGLRPHGAPRAAAP